MKYYPSSLALGGGALKGAAHVGVLQVYEEEGFPIEYIAGTSAGAVVGAAYAMGYSVEELAEILKELATGRVLDFSVKPLPTVGVIIRLMLNMLKLGKHDTQLGLIRTRQLQEYLKALYRGRNFEGLRYPLMVTAVDLRTGRLQVFTSNALARKLKGTPDLDIHTGVDLATAVGASAAIPGIFTPLHFQGSVLVDGGIRDGVPADLVRFAGSRRVVAVDLAPTEQEEEQFKNLLAVLLQTVDIMAEGMKNMIVDRYADYIIRPILEGIELTDFAKLEQIYQYGYQVARESVPALRALLRKQYRVSG